MHDYKDKYKWNKQFGSRQLTPGKYTARLMGAEEDPWLTRTMASSVRGITVMFYGEEAERKLMRCLAWVEVV